LSSSSNETTHSTSADDNGCVLFQNLD